MGSATDTPGPGQYHLGSQLGRQRLSTRPSSPASSLGGRTAIAYKQADVMGPGVCREDSFLKPSSSPNKQWAPQYTFGLKTPITTNDGTEVPGPGARGAERHAALVDATSTRARARGLRLHGTRREHTTRPSIGRNDAESTERFEAPPDRSAPTVAPRAGTSRAAPRGTRAVGPTSTGARAAVAARRARPAARSTRGARSRRPRARPRARSVAARVGVRSTRPRPAAGGRAPPIETTRAARVSAGGSRRFCAAPGRTSAGVPAPAGRHYAPRARGASAPRLCGPSCRCPCRTAPHAERHAGGRRNLPGSAPASPGAAW